MVICKAYRFRLEPDEAQQALLHRFCGHARLVWNKALALQKRRLERGVPLLRYGDLAKYLTLWRASEEYGFLRQGPVHTQQQALKRLDQALWEGLDRNNPKGFPTFRKRGVHDSLRYPDPKQIKLDLSVWDEAGRRRWPKIFLPKVGWVKFRKTREIEGTVKNATVTRRTGRWYVAIQVEVAQSQPLPPPRITALDLGVRNLITLPDGTRIDPPSPLAAFEEKLAWEQRKISRKKKFSRNWHKQKQRLARLHERIANVRKDYLHKLTTHLAKNHGLVVVEDLKLRNMTRSAKGTREAPGTNVRAKAGLNRSILDQGWGMLVAMLAYKLAWRGGMLVKVDPRNTSRRCPRCGHTDPANRPDQPTFRCVECGFAAHADQVGAYNILSRGMEKWRDEGRDTADASVGWLKEKLSSHSPDRLFAECFGEPGPSPV